MSQKSIISFETLKCLFPYFFRIDNKYKVIDYGPSLKKVCPMIEEGAPIVDFFSFTGSHDSKLNLHYPGVEKTLFLLSGNESNLTLRGQVVCLPDDSFLFATSPWLQSPDDLVTLGLGVKDFAVHDPVLDLLNVIQSERMAKTEIRELVTKLSKQKNSLKEANESLELKNQTILETQAKLEHQGAEARKLANVASRTDNAVVITNAHGFIEWVNQSFEKLTEYSLDEVIGKRPGDLLQGNETAPETVTEMREQLKAHQGFNVEIVNYSKSGREYWLHIEAQPIFNSKGILSNFIAVETDITVQKQTEERLTSARIKAEQTSKAMGEFLATVSHEIRTPMNGIIGMLEILMDTNLDNEQKNYLSLIRVSSESLLKIINDVLDLSKIQSSRFELEKNPFELRKISDEVVGLMTFAASKKSLNFEILVHPNLFNDWKGDASRLRQILINLVGNAIKFTEAGSVIVRITKSEERFEGDCRLCFKVTDTGIGIPKNRLTEIFKPFTQIQRETMQYQAGTGLGLSISKQLSDLMQGDIEVSSEIGVGTTFSITIPLEPQILKFPKPTSSAFGKFAIVVALDNLDRESISNHLRTKGMQYQLCNNLQDGLELLNESAKKETPAHYFLICDQAINDVNIEILPSCLEAARKVESSFRAVVVIGPGANKNTIKKYRFADNILYRPLTYEATDGIHRFIATRKEQNASTTAQKESSKTALFKTSTKLLLVEDHPINLEQMILLLKRLGITPDVARNGQEAVMAAQEKEYAVILMDCQMPVMDGFEATREIRKMHQRGIIEKNPFIIAITAFALQRDQEKCLEAGMNAYVTKPIYKKDLIDALNIGLVDNKSKSTTKKKTRSNDNPESAFQRLSSELSLEAAVTLTHALIEMLPEKSHELEAELESGNKEAISRFGHSMKSLCRMNGLERLASLSEELEIVAMSKDDEELYELVKLTQREIKASKETLIEILQTNVNID